MNPIKELGAKLVQDAKLNAESAIQRGVIHQLFPYIYEASKRMSARAICRWLEANGTKLSIGTVAKALKNPQIYWQEIFEDIEPAAIIFAEAHDLEVRDLLANHEQFFDLVHDKNTFPTMEGRLPHESEQDLYDEYLDACARLQEDWFSMPPAAIEVCLASVPDEDKLTAEFEVEAKPPVLAPASAPIPN